jgi:hypothetical protein
MKIGWDSPKACDGITTLTIKVVSVWGDKKLQLYIEESGSD